MEQCFDKEKRFQKIFEPEGRRSGFYNLQRNEYGAGAQTDRYHFYLQTADIMRLFDKKAA